MDNNLELRYVAEIRAVEDRTIQGTAIVFNSESVDLGGFKEIIAPEAISQDLIDNSDIVMVYNHKQDAGILARSKNGKGSLKINLDDKGVNFSFNAKKTALGDEVLEAVRSGDLDACSFAFRLAPKGDKYEKRSDGSYIRTINNIEVLRDFSVVSTPCYEATSVRSFDEFKQSEENINKEKKELELREKEEKELKYNQDLIMLNELIKEITK